MHLLTQASIFNKYIEVDGAASINSYLDDEYGINSWYDASTCFADDDSSFAEAGSEATFGGELSVQAWNYGYLTYANSQMECDFTVDDGDPNTTNGTVTVYFGADDDFSLLYGTSVAASFSSALNGGGVYAVNTTTGGVAYTLHEGVTYRAFWNVNSQAFNPGDRGDYGIIAELHT